MRVLQHSVTQRNVVQHVKSFFNATKVLQAYFLRNRKRHNGASQANRNDFYFFRNAGGELDQSELRLHSTKLNQWLRRCAA